MENSYICKIANYDELVTKCDYEIDRHPNNDMWVTFKDRAIKNLSEGNALVYIGILNDEIICEATANLNTEALKEDISNPDGLVSEEMVYLSGFRTNKEYVGLGYFSKLFHFMEDDLKKKGYRSMCLGVEPKEIRNIQIYFKWGFTNYIKTTINTLPPKNKESLPQEEIVNFYYKEIK